MSLRGLAPLVARLAGLMFSTILALTPAAMAQTSLNSTQTTSTTTAASLPSFNLAVGAIAAFVFMLLGLAAGLLLLVRFTRARRFQD